MIGRNPYYFEDEYYRISGRGPDSPIVTGYWELDLYDENYNHSVGTGGAIHAKENATWDVIRESESCGQYPACPLWATVWHGVCCISEYEIWFAGESSKVMRWTPWGSMEYNLYLSTTFRAIWASSGSNVYIAGDYGYIVHYNGSYWRVMNTFTTESLHDIWGYQEELVATLLQSYSTSVEESQVTIRWSLLELDEDAGFRITRTSVHESTAPVIDDNPTLERVGLSFIYVDLDVDPGGAYEYLIEYSSEDGWQTLFESGTVSLPNVPFALLPNYPNPFNPSTTITYSVAMHGHVTLSIFDVSGKLVRTILNEEHVPGKYTIGWDGLNDQGHRAASGTYFCRLSAGKEAVTQKILLMR